MPRYFRKVIRIVAEDSPNVQLGLMQKAAGLKPTGLLPDGKLVVPGVMPWSEYEYRLNNWDDERKAIGLWAEFYRGKQQMLFPTEVLGRARQLATVLVGKRRVARGIGIDTADGGDKTVWTAVDELGVLDQLAMRTPNTTVIPRTTIAFARKHKLIGEPERWTFDAGGGGYNHACTLKEQGYGVRVVAFGGASIPEAGDRAAKYQYFNRRAQLYGVASVLMEETSFAIPMQCKELYRQLSKIPRIVADEGKLKLPSKRRSKQGKPSLLQLLGCSPDEADSFVLAVDSMVAEGAETGEIAVEVYD